MYGYYLPCVKYNHKVNSELPRKKTFSTYQEEPVRLDTRRDITMLMIYLAMLEGEQDKLKMTELYEEFRYDCLHVALKITNNMAMSEDAVHNAILGV